jgi:hypothetical protein
MADAPETTRFGDKVYVGILCILGMISAWNVVVAARLLWLMNSGRPPPRTAFELFVWPF